MPIAHLAGIPFRGIVRWQTIWLCGSMLLTGTVHAESASVVRAKALARSGKIGEAVSVLRNAIQQGEDASDVHGELGGLYYRSGRFGDAIPELGRAAQLDPKSAPYSIELVSALIGDHRYRVAMALLDGLKASFDMVPAYHYDSGLVAYQLQHYPQAIFEFEKALKLDSTMDQAMFFLANSYAVSGDLARAIPLYRSALKLKPNSASYHLALATVLERSDPEREEEVMNLLQTAFRLTPDDASIELALGLAYERENDLANARTLIEEVSARFPNEQPPHVALARIYRRLRDWPKLKAEVETVRKLEQGQSGALPTGSKVSRPEE